MITHNAMLVLSATPLMVRPGYQPVSGLPDGLNASSIGGQNHSGFGSREVSVQQGSRCA